MCFRTTPVVLYYKNCYDTYCSPVLPGRAKGLTSSALPNPESERIWVPAGLTLSTVKAFEPNPDRASLCDRLVYILGKAWVFRNASDLATRGMNNIQTRPLLWNNMHATEKRKKLRCDTFYNALGTPPDPMKSFSLSSLKSSCFTPYF